MQAPRPAPSSPPSRVSSLGLLDYYDSFLGKSMHIRLAQSVQVDTPFHLIETAAARLHLPRGYAVEHEQARSPTAYMRVSLWPAQLQRAAIGFTCATSHALATAPVSVRVDSGTTRRWGTRILLRVMGGYVSRIQVRDARHALDACVTFCLTSAAANTGGLLDCMPRVPSPRWQGAHPGPLPTVLFSRRRLEHCLLSSCPLLLLCLQAAAAERIAGKTTFHIALQNDDIKLVRDHLVAVPSCVHTHYKCGILFTHNLRRCVFVSGFVMNIAIHATLLPQLFDRTATCFF